MPPWPFVATCPNVRAHQAFVQSFQDWRGFRAHRDPIPLSSGRASQMPVKAAGPGGHW